MYLSSALLIASLTLYFIAIDGNPNNYKFSHDPITLDMGLLNDAEDLINTAFFPPALLSNSNNNNDNNGNRNLLTSEEIQAMNEELDEKYGNYSELFKGKFNYPSNKYINYDGLDDTSLFASQVVIKKDHVYVGMSGFNAYSGAVAVYKLISESEWELKQLINAPCGANSNFGVSIAQDGDWLAVGANAYDSYTGAVCVYKMLRGYWTLHTKIPSPLDQPVQGFGYKLALHGNSVVVSTAVNDVLVYEFLNGKWNRNRPARLSPPEPFAQFGHDVAIFNDLVVVGAPNYTASTGAVYVYQRQAPGNWSLFTTIDSVTGWNSRFGHSVSLYESTIAVGAVGYQHNSYQSPGEDSVNNIGNVYIFDIVQPSSAETGTPTTDGHTDDQISNNSTQRKLDGGFTWQLSQNIPSLLGRSSYFGASVAIHKNSLVIGSNGFPYSPSSDNVEELGAAFVYYKDSSGAWNLTYSLASPADKRGNFGYGVAIHDDYVAVGAFTAEDFRGSLFLAGIPLTKPDDNGGDKESTDDIVDKIDPRKSWNAAYVILAALGLLAAIIAGTLTYCCCCCAVPPPILAKKKKKEEEESPYTVHSYTGYCEIDDAAQAIPPPVPFHQQPSSFNGFLPSLPSFSSRGIEKDPDMMKKDMLRKEKYGEKYVEKGDGSFIVEHADDGFIRKLFPYKVYGPRGYVEGQNAEEFNQKEIDKKIEEDELIRQQSSTSTSNNISSFLIVDQTHQPDSPHLYNVQSQDVDSVLDEGINTSSANESSGSFSTMNSMRSPRSAGATRSRYVEQAKYRYSQYLNSSSSSSPHGMEGASKEDIDQSRFKEEAKIRAEEKARERFAMFKAKTEEAGRGSSVSAESQSRRNPPRLSRLSLSTTSTTTHSTTDQSSGLEGIPIPKTREVE